MGDLVGVGVGVGCGAIMYVCMWTLDYFGGRIPLLYCTGSVVRRGTAGNCVLDR